MKGVKLLRIAGWLAGGGLAIAAHELWFHAYAPEGRLPLGSLVRPLPQLSASLLGWFVFGPLAVGCWSAACLEIGRAWSGSRWLERWRAVSDRSVAWTLASVAAGGALFVRFVVLDGATMTDDETGYRFAAKLLASGRLAVPSHELKLFFDHYFFVNDGRFAPMVFLGWPLLRVPTLWLGLEWAANALLAAAAVPAVLAVGRRLLGGGWGRLAALLFATSPAVLTLAGTDLAHVAAIATLAWGTRAYLEGRDRSGSAAWDVALAGCLGLAFWIRPLATVGLGTPLVVLWLRDRVRGRAMRSAWLPFVVTASAIGGAFLLAQWVMWGSPWKTGYHAMQEYHLANDARFVPVARSYLETATPELDFSSLPAAARRTTFGLFRAGLDFFGWPIGLLGFLLAVGARGAGIPGAMLILGLATVLFQISPGVDSFGPPHYAELVLPSCWLLAAAAARLTPERPRDGALAVSRAHVWGLVAALLAVTWVGFVPIRWSTLHHSARSASAPERLARAAIGEEIRAVVFAPFPWVPPPCMSQPNRYFRWLRPVSDPDLDDRIVWANHLTIERDRELLASFPDRRGYVLDWTPACELRVTPLDSVAADAVPPGMTRLDG